MTIQLGFVAAALVVAGCSEPTYKVSEPTVKVPEPTYRVHGQVVYEDDEQPVPSGVTIVFESTEPPYERASCDLDAEGRFDLSSNRQRDGAMQGEHRVRFTADVEQGRPDAAANMAEYIAAKYADFKTANIKLNINPNDENNFTIMVARPANANDDESARNRFLLLDSRIVEKSENAQLAVGTVRKHEKNPLFVEDKSWEKRFDNLYGNVIFDTEDKVYKCWYSPLIVDRSAKGMTLEQRKEEYDPGPGREMAICFATSEDGIQWTKPELGLVEYEGSKANNILWRGPHGAGIFKDVADSDPARRYKMIMQGLATSHSADGIHWSEPRKIEGIGKIAGDTHNNAFWEPHTQKYVGITRTRGDMGREVTRIESSDFVEWQNTGVAMKGLEESLQPYSMPVFMHGGVYLGLVAIYSQRPVDRTWTELAWSPDTIHWHRIAPGNPLIPCSEKVLDYDYGCVYACAYPVFLENEIRLFYGGSDYLHFGWRNGSLCLATLRPDGFAGYEQESKSKPAFITTTEIPYAGQKIRITADVEEGGSIKVSIVDDQGQDVATAGTVSKTLTDGPLQWNREISRPKIRLNFAINDAKLYSFSFAE